jgi:hypothetical protein
MPHTWPFPVSDGVTIYNPLFRSFLRDLLSSSQISPLTAKAGTSNNTLTYLLASTSSPSPTNLLLLLPATTTMFGFTMYQSACLYASVTAFSATWIAVALPIQHGKAGPFNYHRAIKRGARIPWRRIPGMKI